MSEFPQIQRIRLDPANSLHEANSLQQIRFSKFASDPANSLQTHIAHTHSTHIEKLSLIFWNKFTLLKCVKLLFI